MTTYFDIDVDSLILDYKLSYQNAYENVTCQLKQLCKNNINLYEQKMDENHKISNLLSDINNKINEGRNKVKCMTEKINSEQEKLQSEYNRFECINQECKLLEAEEDKLKNMIDKSKGQLTKVYKEKKGQMKKLKKEINSFKCGVNMYEKFLHLSMNIENREANSIIKINMKNSTNRQDYDVILEENDNDLKLIDIIPHNQSVKKAATLYSQNKDIQGLLAYLYETEE